MHWRHKWVAMHRGCKGLDTSTQGEYTKSKPAFENVKDFNVSKREPQILPLRPAFQKISRLSPQVAPQLRLCGAAFCQDQAARRDLRLGLGTQQLDATPLAPHLS
jgi:hypothetical protein